MEKNRKILISILAFIALSVVLSIIDISLKMNKAKSEQISFSVPDTAPGIGVIRISGPISMSGDGGAFSQIYTSDMIIRQLSKLEQDVRIKAIVLRIDSPGGTVAATQEIFQKVISLRRRNIPIITSMGDVCASGGYYVASASNYIFANQGSITGSIGVIIMAPNLKGLFEKIGLKMEVVKSGKFKDILSSSRDVSPEEIAILQDLINNTYSQFLKDVSLGRNIPISDFEQYADGRVFNGTRAKEYNLVDEVGTYSDAVFKAKELANLPKDAPVYYETTSPIEEFFGMLQGKLAMDSGIESLLKKASQSSVIEYRYVP